MPKRSAEEKMEYYSSKIRRLQEKSYNRRRRVMRVVSDSSESENKSDHEETNAEVTAMENFDEVVETLPPQPNEEQIPPVEACNEETAPVIDAELLTALGDATDDVPKYGEKIHPDLAQRWLPILRKGIEKDNKDKLIREYTIPENCKLLRAPTLNAEIAAAITDMARGRDKKIESSQQQLGVGISALNRAMTLLLTTEDKQNKVQAMKILSDSCRILSDLHFSESQARIKLVTPGLDKVFLNVIQDVDRDETLFGSKLSEKIKASKAIEKQSQQIKKTVAATSVAGPSTYQTSTPTHFRYPGNWTRPARFQPSNRRGRGGLPRFTTASRRPTAPASAPTQPKAAYNKPRAPPRQ